MFSEKRFSQIRELEQRLHHQGGIDVLTARHQNHTHVFRGLVSNVIEERQLAGLEKLRDLFYQARFLHLIGDFGDHHLPRAAPKVFHLPACANAETATPGFVGFQETGFVTDHHAASGKVRPLNELQEVCRRGLRIVDQMLRGRADFGDIVRRN